MSDETTPIFPVQAPPLSHSEYLGNIVREAVRDELMPLDNGAIVGGRLYSFLSSVRAEYQLTLLDKTMINDILWSGLRTSDNTVTELSFHVGNISDRIRFHLLIDHRLQYNKITESLAQAIAGAYGLKNITDVNSQRLPDYNELVTTLNGNGWLVALLLMDKYLPKVAQVVTQREIASRGN